MADILIIDDEPSVRKIIATFLERNGYQVRTADSGVTGLLEFNTRRPALTITDLIMPDKEGLELIREMKAIAPDAKIIAMSGGGFGKAQTYLKLAEKFGAARTFVKPIDCQQVLTLVKEVIGD
ncbi:MAG TPA: response regulator [Desulfobacteraceae bacterium]|nr:response regulator [Desulfobacteraceae bacterium]